VYPHLGAVKQPQKAFLVVEDLDLVESRAKHLLFVLIVNLFFITLFYFVLLGVLWRPRRAEQND
jgi:hypothetical protein